MYNCILYYFDFIDPSSPANEINLLNKSTLEFLFPYLLLTRQTKISLTCLVQLADKSRNGKYLVV